MGDKFKIHTLDLLFQGTRHAVAAYLIEGPRGRILVETGPGSTLQALLEGLRKLGVSPDQVEAVLLTHIHLDHAGAAGWWAQRGTPVYVHEHGARHIIDPGRVVASARRIFGDLMDTLWGEILPAPEDRVNALRDGDQVDVAGLTLTAWDTPGHAKHHHVFQLGDLAFAGDAGGIRKPESSFVQLPAPPPEFDLEAWKSTIDLIQAKRFRRIYVAHFGAVDEVDAHLDELRSLLIGASTLVRERMESGLSREQIIEAYTAWQVERARKVGLDESVVRRDQFSNPLAMSVDGIMRYWRFL